MPHDGPMPQFIGAQPELGQQPSQWTLPKQTGVKALYCRQVMCMSSMGPQQW